MSEFVSSETELVNILNKNNYYSQVLEQFRLHEDSKKVWMSPLSVAIQYKRKAIVKLILEESNYEVKQDVNSKTGDTTIHLACRFSADIQILESLLLNVRQSFNGEKEKIREFLEKENKDGVKAIDYCVFKSRNDMAVILQEFVESSQQVIDIKSYSFDQNFSLCSR